MRISSNAYIKGEYVNGLRNGICFCQFENYEPYKTISYEGEFVGDMKNGYGQLLVDDGSEYNGEWKNDLQSYGIFDGRGHKYMGYWKGKLMDVQGIYRSPDGKAYKGEIKNGKFVGEGELINGNEIIKGHFEKEGDLNEKGQIKTLQGEYEGQVKNGKPHGYGKMIYYDTNEVYEGEWDNGIKHGEGNLLMQDMSRYSGKFEFGKFHGEGSRVYADNSMIQGIFKNGVISYGTYKYKLNNRERREEYIGHLHDDKPNGVGTLKFQNGKRD